MVYTTKKIKIVFNDDQFKFQGLQTIFVVFLYVLQWCKLCWGHIAVVGWPMVFCHMSCVPLAFTWKLGEHFDHQNVVVFFIRMLIFMMFFIWVHQWWMYDEFLDLFNVFHKICLGFILKKLLLYMHQKVAG